MFFFPLDLFAKSNYPFFKISDYIFITCNDMSLKFRVMYVFFPLHFEPRIYAKNSAKYASIMWFLYV